MKVECCILPIHICKFECVNPAGVLVVAESLLLGFDVENCRGTRCFHSSQLQWKCAVAHSQSRFVSDNNGEASDDSHQTTTSGKIRLFSLNEAKNCSCTTFRLVMTYTYRTPSSTKYITINITQVFGSYNVNDNHLTGVLFFFHLYMIRQEVIILRFNTFRSVFPTFSS